MHDVSNRGVRYSLLAAGFMASLFALIGSGILNYLYGHDLARTPMQGVIFGGLAVVSDVFMATSLFFYFEAKKRRQFTMMAASILVWVATSAFAIVAAISQASMNRIDAVAHRAAASTSYADTRTELTEARKARDKIGVWVKAEPAMKAEIERHKTNRLWTQSSECQEIAGKSQREYCAQYQTLVGELATSQMVAKLESRIAALQDKSDATIASNAAVTSEADPAAASISNATGYSQRDVQTGIVFGFAGLMWILCSVGPYITSSMLTSYHQPKHLDAVTVVEPVISLNVGDTPKPELSKQLALPKPDEIAPEWRAVLDELGIPRKKPMGKLAPKEDQDRLGWRWYTWMVSHGHVGQHAADAMDGLYDAYNRAVHCEPTAYRIAKNRLEQVRWVSKTQNPVIWSIKAPTNGVETLRKLLVNKKIIAEAPAAPAAEEETVVPFTRRLFGKSA